jgi:hypothetical protein
VKFKQGNDPRRNTVGRRKGSRNKRTIVREALEQVFEDGEHGFWRSVAEQAKGGDTASTALIANRLVPALKPELRCLDLDLDLPNATLTELSRGLLDGTLRGDIPPDQLRVIMSAIGGVLMVEEQADFEQRLVALEVRP